MCYDPAMLGKIALTLLVIIAAALFLRHRARSQHPDDRHRDNASSANRDNPWQHDSRQSAEIPAGRQARRLPAATGKAILWATLSAIVTAGAALYYLGWQDAREPVTVILHSGNGEPVIYEVRKRDLGERAFTTLDGTRVTVADSERMEVIGL